MFTHSLIQEVALFFTSSFVFTGLCVCVSQTAGLVGAQAELCVVCDGERREQGHVYQERGGQCAQQQQVGVNIRVKV